jgi:hypothetical protein
MCKYTLTANELSKLQAALLGFLQCKGSTLWTMLESLEIRSLLHTSWHPMYCQCAAADKQCHALHRHSCTTKQNTTRPAVTSPKQGGQQLCWIVAAMSSHFAFQLAQMRHVNTSRALCANLHSFVTVKEHNTAVSIDYKTCFL